MGDGCGMNDVTNRERTYRPHAHAMNNIKRRRRISNMIDPLASNNPDQLMKASTSSSVDRRKRAASRLWAGNNEPLRCLDLFKTGSLLACGSTRQAKDRHHRHVDGQRAHRVLFAKVSLEWCEPPYLFLIFASYLCFFLNRFSFVQRPSRKGVRSPGAPS